MDSVRYSTHKISWDGEWLPVELWTKIFYYMLVPANCNLFSVHSRREVEILKRHPRIAEIIAEFLLFRTGLVHADLDSPTIPGHWIPILSPNQLAFRYSFFNWDGYPMFSHGDVKITFRPQSISIDLGYIQPRSFKKSKTGGGYAKLSRADLRKIRIANSILPYGLHFRQVRGVLHLRMPNNPRLGGSKFRYIQAYEMLPNHDDPQWLYRIFEVNCMISLDELYIPSWRPYS
jgi:hypothetical protein